MQNAEDPKPEDLKFVISQQLRVAHEVMERRKSALKAIAVDEEDWALAEEIMKEDEAILSRLAKR